jgi:hypothetical protein
MFSRKRVSCYGCSVERISELDPEAVMANFKENSCKSLGTLPGIVAQMAISSMSTNSAKQFAAAMQDQLTG